MDTFEHTGLGNSLRIGSMWENNPYLRVDSNGILHLRLQRFEINGIPTAMEMEISAGEVVAMAGDYFTQANWTMNLDLPGYEEFESGEELGFYLINQAAAPHEITALMTAYNNLAAPDVTRKQINTIYQINNAQYIPYFSTLNSYIQELMLAIKVKNYGEMLIRNQTHFTPWSVRVYILGHTIALRYARLAYELKQFANDPNYQSDNSDLLRIKKYYSKNSITPSATQLIDLACQYHAQAYSIELFSFHYYSDHFAAGHMSMVGDLRVVLPNKFGIWGSILANSLHDELNHVGVYTYRPYDPTPTITEAPTNARGDTSFDSCVNEENKQRCVQGMQASIQDIHHVLEGRDTPLQKKYGGLEHLPDIDYDIRQPEPLLIYKNNKVYYRTNLKQINILAPSEYDAVRAEPDKNGYTELTSRWAAFVLVFKLRVLSYFYTGVVQPLTIQKLEKIVAEERLRNPGRQPVPVEHPTPVHQPVVGDWRAPGEGRSFTQALTEIGTFKVSKVSNVETDLKETPTLEAIKLN